MLAVAIWLWLFPRLFRRHRWFRRGCRFVPIAILRALLDAIERYGKPRAVRTDNEAVFTSRLFRWSLALLGIRHQRTAPHCPWQNGRVERFFGTSKAKLDRWAVDGSAQLELALADFGDWYNHVRPHQHLGGWTPGEAWAGIDPYAAAPKSVGYFSAWDGGRCSRIEQLWRATSKNHDVLATNTFYRTVGRDSWLSAL